MTRKTAAGVCALLLLVCGRGLGAGFQLYSEGSAEALGQAGAIGGRGDLASLAWYNPSALAGAAQQVAMAGAVFVKVRTDFTSSLAPAADSSMADDWHAVPHLYLVQPVAEQWTLLLSINAPYGLVTEWPEAWAGSPAAIRSELSVLYATPALAWRLNDRLSLSAGFNIVHAAAELTAYRGPALGRRTLAGNDLAGGYTVSGHWQVSEGWGLGMRYQSGVAIEPQGTLRYQNDPGLGNRFDAKGQANLPASFNLGVANRSLDRWRFGAEAVWSEWSRYRNLVFVFPGNPYEPSPETNAKRWQDVWSLRLGVEHEPAASWRLRAGYVWDPSPVPDATRAPELPDADRHMLTAGVGWKGERLSVDLAYAFLWSETVETGAEVAAKVPTAAGHYDTASHLVGISVGTTF